MRKTLRKLLIPVCVSVVALGLLAFMAARLFASTSPEDLIGRAKAWAAQNQYEKAISDLDELITGNPTSDLVDDAHFLKGQYLMALEKNEEALQEYKAIIEEHYTGDMVEGAIEKLAIVYTKLRDIEGGLAYVAGVLQANPSNDAARKARWEIIRRARRGITVPQAVAVLSACEQLELSEADPSELAQVRLAMARLVATVNRKGAVKAFQELIQTTGSLPQIRAAAKLELATLYMPPFPCEGVFDPMGGIKLLEEVVASCPGTEEARRAKLALAWAYAPDNLERAFALFTDAIANRLDEPDAVSSLGILINAGIGDSSRNSELRDRLASLAEQFPGTPLATNAHQWAEVLKDPLAPEVLSALPVNMLPTLGSAYLVRLREYESAEKVADELMNRGENELYMHGVMIKAAVHRLRGEYAEAVPLYDEALRRYPQATSACDVMYLRVGCLRDAGDLTAAIAAADALREAYPENELAPAVMRIEARIYEEGLGDVEAARQVYQDIIDSYPGTSSADSAAARLGAIPSP